MKVKISTKKLKCVPSLNLPEGVVERLAGLLGGGKRGPIEVEIGMAESSDDKQLKTRLFVKKVKISLRTSVEIDAKTFDKNKKTGSLFLCRVEGGKFGNGQHVFSRTRIRGKPCCRFDFDDLIEHVELHEADARRLLRAFLKIFKKQKASFELTITGPANAPAAFERKVRDAKFALIKAVIKRVRALATFALTGAGTEAAEELIRASQFVRLREEKSEDAKKKKKKKTGAQTPKKGG